MLTGRPAFVRETALATLDALLRHDPPPIEAPASLQRLVRHCLEKRPEERFQSARDLAFDLEALAEAPTAALPSSAALPRRRRRGAVDSLAVLPFVNLGADPAADYLSDGITESVINKLSALPRLKVLARATVFRFKGSDADALHTGRQLGVRAVLTGRVMEVGDRLVIRAELADTADGSQLWGEQYERHPADLLRVQNEMAVEIAASLRLRLTGNQRRRLAKRQTEDTRAYRLYLKGRSFLVRRTPASFQEAIRHFEEAVAADPRYALAYSGLADSHCLLERYGVVSPREAMPRARVAADRALELDDSLAEAHCSRALVASYYEWDRPAAMTRFRRALELNPGYATAHHWYGFNLAEWGRTAEAMAEVEAALDLDPLSLIVHANRGTVLYFARQFDEATAQLRRTLDLDATFAVARQWLGRVHEQAGRTDEAIVEHRAALALRGEEPESLANLAHACAIGGRQAEARALLERLLALRGERYVSPYWLAVVYVGLGETEAALRWLEEAAQERFDWMGALGVEPTFDPLRGEARFQELARQVSGG
jgi:serine/threonine-protein kinase